MSKRGEERCGDRFFWGRKVGTEHYDFMHNVEVSAKRVRFDGLKRRGVRVAAKWVWEGAGWGLYGFMHNVEMWWGLGRVGRLGRLWLYA